MRFTAVIKEGKIIWHDERAIAEHLLLIDTEECYIDIKPSKMRNTAQNNYYWALLRDWGNDIGDVDINYMHDLAKTGYRIDSTKELDKDEFSEFLDFVEHYARDHGWKDNQGMKIKYHSTKPL
ncbi:hypothetical protein CMI37_34535 [Candidatus Pacearchaeota archaeon]|nr:hypothetical protein [Candidatus Pacearchaeota archaeon]|tara:strand:+ start:712 stop:1080 length:369 start_codon:yes stop_codon:yes gene_type:complete